MLKKLRKVLLCMKGNRFARQVGTRGRRVRLEDMPPTLHRVLDSEERMTSSMPTSKDGKVDPSSKDSVDGPTIRDVQQRSIGM